MNNKLRGGGWGGGGEGHAQQICHHDCSSISTLCGMPSGVYRTLLERLQDLLVVVALLKTLQN